MPSPEPVRKPGHVWFRGATAWEWQIGRLYGRIGYLRYWRPWLQNGPGVFPPRSLFCIGWDTDNYGDEENGDA